MLFFSCDVDDLPFCLFVVSSGLLVTFCFRRCQSLIKGTTDCARLLCCAQTHHCAYSSPRKPIYGDCRILSILAAYMSPVVFIYKVLNAMHANSAKLNLRATASKTKNVALLAPASLTKQDR
ncbi:hypothetical protein DFH11DRAFT_1599294 [Phellopilus nigrolimitatus]|nr:hypothetical protein DFH11DRAFT_1599294 [Phellopilus nigrolimitatus]